MAVRNQHVRQSSPFVGKDIDGKRYHFYPHSWHVNKNKIRYAINKLAGGKLQVPSDCEVYSGITIVYVTASNELSATEGR